MRLPRHPALGVRNLRRALPISGYLIQPPAEGLPDQPVIKAKPPNAPCNDEPNGQEGGGQTPSPPQHQLPPFQPRPFGSIRAAVQHRERMRSPRKPDKPESKCQQKPSMPEPMSLSSPISPVPTNIQLHGEYQWQAYGPVKKSARPSAPPCRGKQKSVRSPKSGDGHQPSACRIRSSSWISARVGPTPGSFSKASSQAGRAGGFGSQGGLYLQSYVR
jgi:hypothetical protein